MEFHEYAIYYFLIAFTLWVSYKWAVSIEEENRRLKDRNFRLANWLQLAELQTGIAYYSAIGAEAVPGESNKVFYTTLQNRVRNQEGEATTDPIG
jgi:hypothetical protein